MQRAYSIFIPVFFLPIVFIGAFFLLNLLLAVINSKFTEAQHAQDKNKVQVLNEMEQAAKDEADSDLKQALNQKEDISIS